MLVAEQPQTGARIVVRQGRRHRPSIPYKITPCLVTLLQPARRVAVLGQQPFSFLPHWYFLWLKPFRQRGLKYTEHKPFGRLYLGVTRQFLSFRLYQKPARLSPANTGKQLTPCLSLLDWRLKLKLCNLLQENVTCAFAALLYSVQFVCIYRKQFRKATK